MEMNELIREKRLELGYTQSYLADYLGVSMQSVSRWENGITYPDIQLLPLLARVLQIDLNTLFNFKDSLTEREINHFLHKVLIPKMENAENYEEVFKLGMHKIRDYPTCEPLARAVAIWLEEFLEVYDPQNRPEFQNAIDEILDKLMRSRDLDFRNETILMRIPILIIQKQYEKAEILIETLPNTVVDKRIWQAGIYELTNRHKEAKAIYEQKLIDVVDDLKRIFWGLSKTSFQVGNLSEMTFYQEAYEQIITFFGLSDFERFNFQIDMAMAQKDFNQALDLLVKVFRSVPTVIEPSNNPIRKILNRNLEEIIGAETTESHRLKYIEDIMKKIILTEDKCEGLRQHLDFERVWNNIIESKEIGGKENVGKI